MGGDDFAESAAAHSVGSNEGSYEATCLFVLETDITRPVFYAPDTIPTMISAALEAGANAIWVGNPAVSLVSDFVLSDAEIFAGY